MIRFRSLALTTVLVAFSASGGSTQGMDLPGRPAPDPGRAAPDAVDAYVVGVWHLAQATGRAACHQGDVTPELRSLTSRDLEWTQRGMQAHAVCGTAHRFAVVQPLELDTTAVDDLRGRLRELRSDYEHLSESSTCWPPRAASHVRAIVQPVFALGEAAAETLCVIASWNSVLPPAQARDVLRHVEAAQQAASTIPDPGLRSALVSTLGQLPSQISSRTGEDVYHSLVKAVDQVRNVLKGAR